MNSLGAPYEILKHNFSIVSIMISIDYAQNLRGHQEKEPHKFAIGMQLTDYFKSNSL